MFRSGSIFSMNPSTFSPLRSDTEDDTRSTGDGLGVYQALYDRCYNDIVVAPEPIDDDPTVCYLEYSLLVLTPALEIALRPYAAGDLKLQLQALRDRDIAKEVSLAFRSAAYDHSLERLSLPDPDVTGLPGTILEFISLKLNTTFKTFDPEWINHYRDLMEVKHEDEFPPELFDVSINSGFVIPCSQNCFGLCEVSSEMFDRSNDDCNVSPRGDPNKLSRCECSRLDPYSIYGTGSAHSALKYRFLEYGKCFRKVLKWCEFSTSYDHVRKIDAPFNGLAWEPNCSNYKSRHKVTCSLTYGGYTLRATSRRKTVLSAHLAAFFEVAIKFRSWYLGYRCLSHPGDPFPNAARSVEESFQHLREKCGAMVMGRPIQELLDKVHISSFVLGCSPYDEEDCYATIVRSHSKTGSLMVWGRGETPSDACLSAFMTIVPFLVNVECGNDPTNHCIGCKISTAAEYGGLIAKIERIRVDRVFVDY